jgi:hypothetical protein
MKGFGTGVVMSLAVLMFAQVGVSEQPPQFKSLKECQAQVSEWSAWYERNLTICNAALKDKKLLLDENIELERQLPLGGFGPYDKYKPLMQTSAAFCGLGLGGSIVFVVLKVLKRLWPVSAASKQLVVLVAGAIWVTCAAVVGANDNALSTHPVNLLFTVLVYSLPAFLFGGIGFWWFGKAKQQQETM